MEEQLCIACQDGDVDGVKRLLLVPNINLNNEDETRWTRTPFFLACQNGHLEIVKLLNDERVDVNKTNEYDATPFLIACLLGHFEIVKLLLSDKRIDINKADNDGVIPFSHTCYFGYIEIVKLLLNDNRVDINKVDKYGATPFSKACHFGYIEIVEYILASGRDVNVYIDYNGKMMIDQARNGKEIIKLLKDFNINPIETRTKLRLKLGFSGKLIYFTNNNSKENNNNKKNS